MSVRADVVDGVLRLTIDRPDQRNALNAEVSRGLIDGLERAGDDDAVRVVVVTGAGDRAFCAGADLTGVRANAGAVAQHDDRALFAEVLQGLRRCPKPSIARINGLALAGGFGLALACDLAVAVDTAELGTPEVNVGMWPYMISPVIADHLGPKRTMDLLLTGRRIRAAEALSWGALNAVVPADRLDETVDGLAASLSAKSPLVLALGKRATATAAGMHRDEALSYLASMLSLHLQTQDVAEGIAAFLEKRDPRWTGR